MGIGKNIHKSIFVLGEARYSRHGHLRHKGESSSVNGGGIQDAEAQRWCTCNLYARGAGKVYKTNPFSLSTISLSTKL